MAVLRKLIAHTQNLFLVNQGNSKKAFTRKEGKEVSLLQFQKEWQSERSQAWKEKEKEKYTAARLSGWSWYYSKPPFEVEFFSVQGRRINEGKTSDENISTWFTGGLENCRCFLIFLAEKGNLINGCEWDLEIVPVSKARENYESIFLQTVLEEKFEAAGEGFFLSKDASDYNMYTISMVWDNKCKAEALEFDSFYKKLDNWQVSLLQKIVFAEE